MNRRNLLKRIIAAPFALLFGTKAVAEPFDPTLPGISGTDRWFNLSSEKLASTTGLPAIGEPYPD